MTIQFSTGNNISGSENVVTPLVALLSEQLSRFKNRITRIDVHLSNENGLNEEFDEIKCLIEARIERRHPIAITHQANTYKLAVTGATEKLISLLDKMADRLKQQLKG